MNHASWSNQLLLTLAHDVRTPLNSLMRTLTLLEWKHRDHLDDEDRADIATLRSDIRSIVDLHEGILDHVSLADERSLPARSEVDLDEELSACADVVRPLAASKGLRLSLALGGCPPIRSNRPMIRRLVGNLLSNAVRYTNRGAIVLRSRVSAASLMVEVEDTGIGISPEDVGRIFDAHVRVADLGGGHGLGLAMARRTAELLGGHLSVASEPGRGSTFTLSLPASISPPAPPPIGRSDRDRGGYVAVMDAERN